MLGALPLGLVTGGAYFAGTLYWITDVMVTFGGLPRLVGVLVNAGLVAYLALYIALFAITTSKLIQSLPWSGLILTPFAWVALELARAQVFGGFPWVLLGYSQVDVLPVAQAASVFGIYGVSGLVAFVNAAIACAVVWRSRSRFWPIGIAVVLVAGTAFWGSRRIHEGALVQSGTPLKIGLIQGNVLQEQKWDPSRADQILRSYLALSREAIGKGARFVIWPESSTPFYFEDDARGAGAIRDLARESRVSFLIGSDQIDRQPVAHYYNAAFLVTPTGQTGAVYRKIHLVPFGEYVPLKRMLFFAAPLVESVSDFSAGDDAVLLPLDGHQGSAAICYEIVYPDLIRQFVLKGSELLVAITNDAWYGQSSAPYQHFSQAAMRAIEQGRYLARAANTGISGIVDPYGRQIVRSRMFEPAAIVGDVRLLSGLTLYARIGDLFAYLSALLTAAALTAGMRGRARNL